MFTIDARITLSEHFKENMVSSSLENALYSFSCLNFLR